MRFLVMITMLCFSITSEAQSVRRLFQDVKLPTQGVVEQQSFTNLLAATTNTVLNGSAGSTSAAIATVTTFAAQPDSPRNLRILPGGTTTDVEACDIVVAGTNIFDRAITETFSFLANASTETVGAEAFKTVTSVTFPANCESGSFAATWSIGLGEKIGLKRCMAEAGAFVQSSLNGAKEATAATVVADADEVEKNTVDFNGAMNGTNDHKAYFIQNYGCFP
jgi:hypothetical protein